MEAIDDEISTDLNVRRMYAIWTEGMSALDQARIEGIEEGKEEGREEGREEERIEIALNLIKLGTSADIVAIATKLPAEKIEELQKKCGTDDE